MKLREPKDLDGLGGMPKVSEPERRSEKAQSVQGESKTVMNLGASRRREDEAHFFDKHAVHSIIYLP